MLVIDLKYHVFLVQVDKAVLAADTAIVLLLAAQRFEFLLDLIDPLLSVDSRLSLALPNARGWVID